MARTGGLPHPQEPAGGREEAVRGILGVEAGLYRVTAHPHVLLCQGQRLPRSHPQLQLDEVEAGHELGDRVLDL